MNQVQNFKAYNVDNLLTEVNMFINLDRSLNREILSISHSSYVDYTYKLSAEYCITVHTCIIVYRVRKWYHF